MEYLKPIFALFSLVLVVSGQEFDGACAIPPPIEVYTEEVYQGFWNEIARIQLPLGGIFQQDSYCNGIDFVIDGSSPGVGRIDYTSRKGGFQGEFYNATARLEPEATPGEYYQIWEFETNNGTDIEGTHDHYFVLWVEPEYSLAYACTQDQNGHLLDYAIHFQARGTSIPQEKFEFLYDLAVNQYGLNYRNDTITWDKPVICCYEYGESCSVFENNPLLKH